MKKLILALLLFIPALGLFAQDFPVPENYVLKNAEDYDKYQGDVIKTIDWIMNTPINKSKSERKDANAFIMN